jgi:predicted polyphosphate/ATP-dependent NAD kinase
MAILENKVLRKKKIDKDLNVKVIKNDASERLFVEFSSKDNKLVMQKMFQNTFHGRLEAQTFEDSFQSYEEFKEYFNKKSGR